MIEKSLEKKLKNEIEKLGGKCEKWINPYHTGMPDRIVLLPDGITFFVELKAENGVQSPRQKHVQAELLKLGHSYVLLRGEKGLTDFLNMIRDSMRNSQI